MRVEIGYDPDEGKNLAFYRCLPSIGVGAVDRREVGIVKGIAEKYVAPGGNLGARQTGKRKESKENESNFSHGDRPTFLARTRRNEIWTRVILDACGEETVDRQSSGLRADIRLAIKQ